MRTTSAFLAIVLLSACTPPASVDPNAGDAVREQEASFSAAVAAENLDASAAFYAPDAQLFNPGAAPSTTPDAVRAAYASIFDDPNGALTFSADNVIVPSSGDYAIAEGNFTITYSNAQSQPESASGRYITVWRHEDDGSWKIVRDIATPGAPSTPAPAAP
jgi:ketosteroid isomerase-like protein